MDAASLSSALSSASVGGQVAIGVLKATQSLEQQLAATLFASLGLGTAVDAHA